jgi:hypothetical protein
MSRSIVLKILAGAAVFALSFWLTLLAMDQLEPVSPWDPNRSNPIATFGDASTTGRVLADDVTFRFGGNGYAEIEGTDGLQCLKYECKFSLMAAFAPLPPPVQLIIGQSFSGENGWHLLLVGERLVLQIEGGTINLDGPFTPKPGQRYKMEIARDGKGARVSVDGVVVVKGDVLPFTDIARNLTIGGRPGPNTSGLSGAVSEVSIFRLKPQQYGAPARSMFVVTEVGLRQPESPTLHLYSKR